MSSNIFYSIFPVCFCLTLVLCQFVVCLILGLHQLLSEIIYYPVFFFSCYIMYPSESSFSVNVQVCYWRKILINNYFVSYVILFWVLIMTFASWSGYLHCTIYCKMKTHFCIIRFKLVCCLIKSAYSYNCTWKYDTSKMMFHLY